MAIIDIENSSTRDQPTTGTKRPLADQVATLPPFVEKLYELVFDETTDDIISWHPERPNFSIWNVDEFSKKILPRYFRHRNLSSFVRQLNLYGFHKVKEDDSNSLEFHHPHFLKNDPASLADITRRYTVKRQRTEGTTTPVETATQAPPAFATDREWTEAATSLRDQLVRANREIRSLKYQLAEVLLRQADFEDKLERIGFMLPTTFADGGNFMSYAGYGENEGGNAIDVRHHPCDQDHDRGDYASYLNDGDAPSSPTSPDPQSPCVKSETQVEEELEPLFYYARSNIPEWTM